ncbi:hypothetical protein DPEC_G00304560 [Dallia pectoralis]|uniref:Uncharacterized protein n=1 Tax=Dallia pectoralis TaxID=75939 RepID=A0ACC2FDL2_DALPE|nr:hypothetical protein DPEC_G00304560 [Dallia pectoralis]
MFASGSSVLRRVSTWIRDFSVFRGTLGSEVGVRRRVEARETLEGVRRVIGKSEIGPERESTTVCGKPRRRGREMGKSNPPLRGRNLSYLDKFPITFCLGAPQQNRHFTSTRFHVSER